MATLSVLAGGRPADPAERTSDGALWALTADAGWLDAERRDRLAHDLERLGGPQPVLRLVTCHRVEVYGAGSTDWARPVLGPDGPRRLSGSEAVGHLFRVAAGLESAIVGEDQVLSQLRDAARTMRAAGSVATPLDRLVQVALHVGRRARSGRGGSGPSLADLGLDRLEGRLGPLSGLRVLVVGTGPMGSAARRAALARGARVTVASRSPRPTERRARVLGLRAAATAVQEFDAVVVALAGPWQALADTEGLLPPIVDLSAPGAVPAAVRDGLDGRYVGIDALYLRRTDDDAFTRRASAEVAVAERAFLAWLAARPSAAQAERLVERATARTERRLARTLRRLPELDERGRAIVRQLAVQVAADLLHDPLARLGADADGRARDAADELFDL